MEGERFVLSSSVKMRYRGCTNLLLIKPWDLTGKQEAHKLQGVGVGQAQILSLPSVVCVTWNKLLSSSEL